MTNSPNDGGPAFPTDTKDKFIPTPGGGMAPASHYGWEPHEGMSLRDYFAASVSPQEIEWYAPTDAKACREFLKLPKDQPWTGERYMEIVQIIKYRIADAMLNAREAK